MLLSREMTSELGLIRPLHLLPVHPLSRQIRHQPQWGNNYSYANCDGFLFFNFVVILF